MLTLRIQKTFARFEPSTIYIADVDTVTIRVNSAKNQKTVISANGKTYAVNNGVVNIPRTDIDSNVLLCKYQTFDENGKMTSCIPCESLLCVPLHDNDSEWKSEREFYQQYIKDIATRLAKVERFVDNVSQQTNARVSALEKGKFTLCKFKEENK